MDIKQVMTKDAENVNLLKLLWTTKVSAEEHVSQVCSTLQHVLIKLHTFYTFFCSGCCIDLANLLEYQGHMAAASSPPAAMTAGVNRCPATSPGDRVPVMEHLQL